MTHPLSWFKERIGKRVYRGHVSCPCRSCVEVEQFGVVIADNLHAAYLQICQEIPGCEYREEA